MLKRLQWLEKTAQNNFDKILNIAMDQEKEQNVIAVTIATLNMSVVFVED